MEIFKNVEVSTLAGKVLAKDLTGDIDNSSSPTLANLTGNWIEKPMDYLQKELKLFGASNRGVGIVAHMTLSQTQMGKQNIESKFSK